MKTVELVLIALGAAFFGFSYWILIDSLNMGYKPF